MPEIRKDYVTSRWVVIATERAQRPEDLRHPKEETERAVFEKLPKKKEDCPFCQGNESQTPPEIIAFRPSWTMPNTPGWWVRCIPNKYPALRIEGEVNHRVSQLHNRMNGVGAHEVVIEAPEHNKTIANMSNQQVAEIISLIKSRYNDLIKDTRFKYILIFKNHGRDAGASMEHPHQQIIATPIIPKRIMEELTGARRYYESTGGMCLFDDIIESELESGERIIANTKHFIAICPYAASFPFEAWVLPKKHDPSFEDINDQEKNDLATMLQLILGKMYVLLDNPPYNFILHTAPCDRNDYRFYHWHLEIVPRLTRLAGFEWGTGFYINPTPPEQAAKFLRETKALCEEGNSEKK
ncbi:MAG: galactose-1-phosphate uridylyltransferase [Thermoplasmata archaeon]